MHENLLAEEMVAALAKMRKDMENNYISMGEMLAAIKRKNVHRINGYETFGDYIEHDHGISRTVASKLIKIYQTYIEDLDKSEEDLKVIGLDKLVAVHPIIKHCMGSSSVSEMEEWFCAAEDLTLKELKAKIKEHKENTHVADMKDVLSDQVWDNVINWLGHGNKKETMYKLACYFSGVDMEALSADVKKAVREIETQIRGE